MEKCKIEGCTGRGSKSRDKEYFPRGYCLEHYGKLNNGETMRSDRVRGFHPLWGVWSNMKDRCLNKRSTSYKNYGGRGITICDRWLGYNGFYNFIDDMGVRPEGMSLDRIDNNGNYSKENCRWATHHEQAANTRQVNNIVGVRRTGKYWSGAMTVHGVHFSKSFKEKEKAIEYRKFLERKYLNKEITP